MKTFLIIDVQKGFMKEECLDLPGKIREHVQSSSYDHILFSQFINNKDTNFVKLLN